jgi:hypothetical protein
MIGDMAMKVGLAIGGAILSLALVGAPLAGEEAGLATFTAIGRWAPTAALPLDPR